MQLEWDYRVSDFLGAAETFINETTYPVTYNPKGSLDYLWHLVNDPDTGIFVHYVEDKFAGLIICHRDKEFQNEYFGYVSKMYVLPDFRGTGTGRALLAEAVDWFDRNECVLSFATATASIGQDQRYINLLAKYDFVPHGTVLIRKRKET